MYPPPRIAPLPLVAATALSVCMGGCFGSQAPGQVDLWVAGEMVVLSEQTPRFVDYGLVDARAEQVELTAAGNETVSFQMVFDPADRPLENLRVSIDPPRSTSAQLPADSVHIFHMRPVTVTRYPPWYLRVVGQAPAAAGIYDPLVPLETGPDATGLSAQAGQRQAFWVDLRVGHTAVPGRYSMTIRLESDTHETVELRVRLDVIDLVLPDRLPLVVAGGFDHRQIYRAFVRRLGEPFVPTVLNRRNPQVRQGLVRIRELMVLAHRHRIDLFETALRPVMKRNLDGSIRLDWSDYDAIVTPYLDGSAFADRIGVRLWPLPVCRQWPDSADYGHARQEAYLDLFGDLTRLAWDHFRQIGASDKAVLWPWRGPVGPAGHEMQDLLARRARHVAADLPILSTLPLFLPVKTGWRLPEGMAGRTDLLAPPADWFSTLPQPASGLESPPGFAGRWLSPGTPPYLPSLGLVASAADVRAIPWFALQYRCKGLLLRDVLHWTAPTSRAQAGAQTRLFYPGGEFGSDQVLPSVRLKRLRRGLEDVALLWILQQRDLQGVARSFVESMTRYAGLHAAGDHYLDPRLNGWVQDPLAWRLARELMLREAMQAVHPDTAMGPAERSAMQLRWQQLTERTRKVRVERVRSQARAYRPVAAAPDAGEKMQIVSRVDLYNEHGREVRVALAYENLPAEIQAQGPVEVVLAPGQRVEAILVAVAPIRRFPGNGKANLSIRVDCDVEPARSLAVDLPLVHAGPIAGQPVIDGKLNDWPLRLGSQASDFSLLGRRGLQGEGLASQQTDVFVIADDENLYFAFRCHEPEMDALTAQPSNIIRYQQLMAVGEDLVEIVLDPGQRAVDAEGLFHLLVKPNGVLRSEYGIHCKPPLGQARPWPVPAQVAVAREQAAWVVELRIPLSAFPEENPPRFWGINFTRYRPRGAEASNWAGAKRYYYHPKNLGTMILPDREK